MAYREASMAAGLPFPRKNLGVFTAFAMVASAAVFLLLVPFVVTPPGSRMVKEGGLGMLALLVLAFFVAGVLGALGALAVRGKGAAATATAAVPALPVVAGAFFHWLAFRRVLGAVSVASIDPTLTARILAQGTAEVDCLLLLGCGIGACAFGAASVALLGAGASLDRARSGAPAGKGFLAPLVLGVVGVLVAIGLRVSLHAAFPSLVLAVPLLAIVTALAAIAAGNAPLVRGWHDRREAGAWATGLLAAALLGGAALWLVGHASAMASEMAGLAAISGESIDDSQKARILAEVLERYRAANLCGLVDGLVAFAIVASALLPALGRGPDGAVRAPFGPPVFAAVGGVAALVGALAVAGASTFGGVSSALSNMDARSGASIVSQDPDLPRVGERGSFMEGTLEGPSFIVHADGSVEARPRGLDESSDNMVLFADRRATYGAVAKAIDAALVSDKGAGYRASFGRRRTVSLLVLALPAPRPLDLGPYGIFLKPGAPTVGVALDSMTPDDERVVAPKATDDINAVVAAIIAAQTDATGHASFLTRVVLRPPHRDAW